MTVRGAGRRAGALGVALPLGAATLLGLAGPASAQVDNPGAGTIFSADATVRITASYGGSGQTERLLLTPPGGAAVVVASAGSGGLRGGTLEYLLDTRCWDASAPDMTCSSPRPAPNGSWRVSQTGGTTDDLAFALRIDPLAPTGVNAEAMSPNQARVSWRRGSEPDLTGFAVLEGDRTVAETGLGACTAEGCSALVNYAATGSGAHSYVVKARRSDGGSGTLSSPASAASATSLDAAPADASPVASGGSPGPVTGPSPTPSPGGSTGTASGSSSGAPASSGSPRSGGAPAPGTSAAAGGSAQAATEQAATAQAATAQRQAFASGFSSFGPKLGIPKLPPLPQTQAPDVAPLPDGTFAPTLGFTDQIVREKVDAGPVARVGSAVGSALDSDRLARSAAGALVLLLAGAHLRRWLASGAREG